MSPSGGRQYKVIYDGDFTASFELSTFANDAYTTVVNEESPIYLGSELYVRISWVLPAYQNLRFTVYDCYVTVGEQDRVV